MKDKNPIYLSVIIPVFNETKRLQKLDAVFAYLKTVRFTSELIIVNDGSTDESLEILESFKKEHNFKLLSYHRNKGKGYALKFGVKEANGKYILLTDVDLSTPITEFEKFKTFINQYDVIIGTRKSDSATLLVRQPKFRELLGKGFTLLSRVVLNLNLSDFTCGFKCFSNRCAKLVFSKSKINRWGYDSEVLFLANKFGYEIKEVPVVWKNDPQTKVRFPQDVFNSLQELLTIRLNGILGKYN